MIITQETIQNIAENLFRKFHKIEFLEFKNSKNSLKLSNIRKTIASHAEKVLLLNHTKDKLKQN